MILLPSFDRYLAAQRVQKPSFLLNEKAKMTEALKIKEIAGQAGQQNDCRIYDIYKHKDRLQVFIDKKSKDLAVSLKDCENVFHSLRFLLHSELPHVLENRRLEVSSPGIEKQLREKWHFEESIGEMIKLITTSPVKAQNIKTGASFCSQSFKAHLISTSEKNLNLKSDLIKCFVPFSKIKTAKLIFKNPNKNKQQIKKRGE